MCVSRHSLNSGAWSKHLSNFRYYKSVFNACLFRLFYMYLSKLNTRKTRVIECLNLKQRQNRIYLETSDRHGFVVTNFLSTPSRRAYIFCGKAVSVYFNRVTVKKDFKTTKYNLSNNYFCSDQDKQDWKKMVDPKRVLSYEDMLKVINQPEKVIIDVREPDEIENTGKIPSSINIPLGYVQDALECMSEEEFKKNFCREKPSASDELIFYCKTGRRSSKALDKALSLGYTNSKTYLGSWIEWNDRQK